MTVKLVPVPVPTLVPAPIPLAQTAREAGARVKAALDRNRDVTERSITAACELARESRRSSEASSRRLKAVHPNKPLPSGDITEKFEAIRANVR